MVDDVQFIQIRDKISTFSSYNSNKYMIYIIIIGIPCTNKYNVNYLREIPEKREILNSGFLKFSLNCVHNNVVYSAIHNYKIEKISSTALVLYYTHTDTKIRL